MAHAKNENSKENRSFRNVKISMAAGKPAAFAENVGRGKTGGYGKIEAWERKK